MGVLGFTPFLQKICPEVIKRVPDRLNGISGKTVVFDGTLITQRLHYAPVPQRNRHVLGWYRLLNDLRQSNVSAICVFDGKERNAAKSAETLRRKNARNLTATRFQAERARLQRLHAMSSVASQFTAEDWKSVQSKFREIAEKPKPPSHLAVNRLNDSVIGDDDLEEAFPNGYWRENAKYIKALDKQLEQAEIDEFMSSKTPSMIPGTMDTVELQSDSDNLERRDEERNIKDSDKILRLCPSVSYNDYLQNVPPLETLPAIPGPLDSDTEVDAAMSKNQLQLAADESLFWDSLSGGELTESELSDEATPAEVLASLTERSELLSESYRRRIDAPTAQTYDESREIIRAMGIPCFETTGAYEAEAAAASLVLKGYADYVASEDTDVLVYEAPLLRNISNRADPLIIISGAEVRDTLQLSRESFVDFALLLGTDFSQRIKNVGPIRALKFIKQHGSIENVLANEIKYPPRIPMQEYLNQVTLAREAFRMLPPVTFEVEEQLKKGQADVDSVELKRVMGKFGLTREMVEDTSFSDALAGNYFSDNPSPL